MKLIKIFPLLAVAGIAALIAIAVPASPAHAAASITDLDPDEGEIGDRIDIEGEDWPPSIEEDQIENWVDIYFTSEEAERYDNLDDDITAYELVKENVPTDNNGDFDTYFDIPDRLNDGDDEEDVVGGTYWVCITYQNGDQIKAVADFTIIAGEISISPDDGVVGTEVDIDGENFADDEEITIYYDGDRLDSDYIVDCDEETDGDGDMECTIIIPPSSNGDHTIRVEDESISSAEATFSVDASAEISPTNAPPGDPVEVTGNGFDDDDEVTISIDGEEVATEDTDSDGSFTVEFNVPELEEGSYDIEVTDGSNSVDLNFDVDIGTEVAIIPATTQESPGWVGQNVNMTGSDFDPSTQITISLASTPQVIATTTSDANGDFNANFDIPQAAHGAHTITASDGTNAMTVPYYIESEKPSIPAPILPEDDGKAPGRTEFDWGDVTDQSMPVTYSLQVANDESFNQIILEVTDLPTSEYTLPEGTNLPDTSEENPYYWRVRATDAASNAGDWSAPDSFHVGGFSMPGGASLIHLWWGLGATGAGFLGYYLGKRRAYYF